MLACRDFFNLAFSLYFPPFIIPLSLSLYSTICVYMRVSVRCVCFPVSNFFPTPSLFSLVFVPSIRICPRFSSLYRLLLLLLFSYYFNSLPYIHTHTTYTHTYIFAHPASIRCHNCNLLFVSPDPRFEILSLSARTPHCARVPFIFHPYLFVCLYDFLLFFFSY